MRAGTEVVTLAELFWEKIPGLVVFMAIGIGIAMVLNWESF